MRRAKIVGIGIVVACTVIGRWAWAEIDVPQCGFCQPGMIMAVADFLEHHPEPSDDDINDGITNICRCGTYSRVRKAIHRAAAIRVVDK